VDPQDIRAAAEIHRELGPEYSDAVIAAFIDRVDRAVAARVEARIAAERWLQPTVRDSHRRTLLKGVALGVCAGALVAGVSISDAHANGNPSWPRVVIPRDRLGPEQGVLKPDGLQPRIRIRPAPPLPPPAA
jgi:hypothetical protein